MKEVLVFSTHSSSRLQYVLYWIFRNRLGLDFTITDSRAEFESYPAAKINYSNEYMGNCMNIYASSVNGKD
jgi:hypothetical protein